MLELSKSNVDASVEEDKDQKKEVKFQKSYKDDNKYMYLLFF